MQDAIFQPHPFFYQLADDNVEDKFVVYVGTDQT